MVLNDVLDYCEAESRAALLARAGLVHTVEALEDSFEGLGRYARAIVLDAHLDLPLVRGTGDDSHGALGAPVLDGVVHQVAEALVPGG